MQRRRGQEVDDKGDGMKGGKGEDRKWGNVGGTEREKR